MNLSNLDKGILRSYSDYFILAAVIIFSAVIRFWNLDLKFLWLDEMYTTVLSLGRSFNEVPLGVALPISKFNQIFSINYDATWRDIFQTVISEESSPPVFFCLMHSWLKLVGFSVWNLRALPALIGVLAVVAIYILARVAFSRKAGLMSAALMSFSPFAVYLSQEARHYTLPMLLLIIALIGLVMIQKDISQRRYVRWPVLLGWILVNSIGFYVHYFYIFPITTMPTKLKIGGANI